MKISVIVPVYNVEEYLEKCLDSLVNQTLKDIEIIIVNDGTKDNSQVIIDKYKTKYKNIKSYIKENGGLSDARNFGIKKATGDYIAFLDSDDYVEKNTYEIMYKKAITKNFDIVVCNTNYVFEKDIKKVNSNVKKDIFTKNEIKRVMTNIYPSAWNKIYKKDLLKNIEFKKNVWFEDVEFLYRLIPKINTIGVVDDYLINYVQREGAITKTFDHRLYNYIDNFNGILEYYKRKKIYNEYKNELEFVYVKYLYTTFLKQCCNYNKKDYLKAVNTAKQNVKEHFPNYRKNKLFIKNGLEGIYMVLYNQIFASIIYKRYHK